MSNNSPAAKSVTYRVGFSIPPQTNLGSVVVEACSNSPLIDLPCTAPDGFDWSNSNLIEQEGLVNFSISPVSTSNRLVFSLDSQITVNENINQQFILNGVDNPNQSGSLYFRISTHETLDSSGNPSNWGGVATQINESMTVSTEVPPMLYFCIGISIDGFDCTSATGSYIDFGELRTDRATLASSQFVVGTNADFGYTVSTYGTTMTSGNNIIPSLSVPSFSATGEPQFGINLRFNSQLNFGQDLVGSGEAQIAPDYNLPNRFKFEDGDLIASSQDVSLENKFTTTYLVNVGSDQPPGVYSTSILYTALASF